MLDGTYAGGFTTDASGTASARIAYVAEHRWGARIDGSGQDTAWQNDGNYVDIQGFDVFGSQYLGIDQEGSHSRIIGNHVHDLAPAACTANGGAGIDDANYHASDDSIIGNVVNGIQMPDGSMCDRIHGIYQANPRGIVVNNIVYNVTGAGIHLYHYADNETIANNLVWGSGYGLVFAANSATLDHSHVVNNILIDNTYGIDTQGNLGDHNRVVDNIVYHNDRDRYYNVPLNDVGTISEDPKFVDFKATARGTTGRLRAAPRSTREPVRVRHRRTSTGTRGRREPAST